MFLFEEFVEKVEKEILIWFFAEDLFETIIGEKIDVAFLGGRKDVGIRSLLKDVLSGFFGYEITSAQS